MIIHSKNVVRCLAAVLVLSLAGAARGQLYVSTCGNNGWSGQNQTCSAPDGPKRTIQAAINASPTGGTIRVFSGTYVERIDFLGRPITLESFGGPGNTTIQGTGFGPVVTCESFEGPDTKLIGFTITGGQSDSGGGMLNYYSSPTVSDCVFVGNSVTDNGGGMCNYDSSPTVTDCTFSDNYAGYAGGGFYTADGNPTLVNCTFEGNTADPGVGETAGGGGIFSRDGTLEVTNCAFSGNWSGYNGGGMNNYWHSDAVLSGCTFSKNSADNVGGGIYIYQLSTLTVANSVLWGDATPGGSNEISKELTGSASFRACNIKGCGGSASWDSSLGSDDGGNIDADPRFVDAAGTDGVPGTGDEDLRLGAGSACIDAGDNTAVAPDTADLDGDGNTTEPVPWDRSGNPRFVDALNYPDTGHGTPPLVDMGAYEASAHTPTTGGPHPFILWRKENAAANSMWLMAGRTKLPGSGPIAPAARDWIVAGTGDFDGDGADDILWRHLVSGKNCIWLMDGTTKRPGSGPIQTAATYWSVAGIGYFNGDDYADILWRNQASGKNCIWMMYGRTKLAGSGPISTAGTNWYAVGIGYFNDDNYADILWRDASRGKNTIWMMNGRTKLPASGPIDPAGINWSVAGTGYFNDDDQSDILWRDHSSGKNWMRMMDGRTTLPDSGPVPTAPVGWYCGGVRDFDRDGTWDILWRRNNGKNAIWLMNGRHKRPGSGPIPSAGTIWNLVGTGN
jgi:parallel beta-helix repeat protein